MVSFVIPVYNESESLRELHKLIVENVQKIKNASDDSIVEYEILFVDDGSTDDSVNIIKNIHDSCRNDSKYHQINKYPECKTAKKTLQNK